MKAFGSNRSHLPSNLRRPAAILTVLAVSAMLAGAVTTSWMAVPQVPVLAACQSANQGCGVGDVDKTAVVDAAYFIPGGSSVTPVEPGAATTWTIAAHWGAAPPSNCNDYIEVAYVDVSWNGTAWATANFAGTTGITGVAVCALSTCGSHSSTYRLYVDVVDPFAGAFNLRQVIFTATTVPNGTDFDATTCALGSSRSPTAANFTSTDGGSFECAYNCSATGATVNLTYN